MDTIAFLAIMTIVTVLVLISAIYAIRSVMRPNEQESGVGVLIATREEIKLNILDRDTLAAILANVDQGSINQAAKGPKEDDANY